MSIADKLEAALAEEQAKHQWQDIETAPKDGTFILIRRGEWITTAWWQVCGSNDLPRWHHMHGWFPREDEPSHWQPMPPSPPQK